MKLRKTQQTNISQTTFCDLCFSNCIDNRIVPNSIMSETAFFCELLICDCTYKASILVFYSLFLSLFLSLSIYIYIIILKSC